MRVRGVLCFLFMHFILYVIIVQHSFLWYFMFSCMFMLPFSFDPAGSQQERMPLHEHTIILNDVLIVGFYSFSFLVVSCLFCFMLALLYCFPGARNETHIYIYIYEQ